MQLWLRRFLQMQIIKQNSIRMFALPALILYVLKFEPS